MFVESLNFIHVKKTLVIAKVWNVFSVLETKQYMMDVYTGGYKDAYSFTGGDISFHQQYDYSAAYKDDFYDEEYGYEEGECYDNYEESKDSRESEPLIRDQDRERDRDRYILQC